MHLDRCIIELLSPELNSEVEKEFIERIKKSPWASPTHIASLTIHLYSKLKKYPKGSSWLILCQNASAFTAAFFAVLHAEQKVILPRDFNIETLGQINADGVIDDLGRQVKTLPGLNPFDYSNSKGIKTLKLKPIDLDTSEIEIYTSGSSGVPKKIDKKLAQLDAEVQVLQKLWPQKGEVPYVYSTITHQHIYGLLFKILWPMSQNRFFNQHSTSMPASFWPVTSGKAIFLITCPTHLEHLRQLKNWGPSPELVQRIFSSGGPLAYPVVETLRDQFHFAPTEVYGSSETGGVAYRSREQMEKTPWKSIPGVEIKAEGQPARLQVHSPFCFKEGWFQTEDQVEILDTGEFHLLGRADRIIKYYEKRISLPELEGHLKQNPFVDKAVVLSHQPVSKTSPDLVALVYLSKLGWSQFDRQNRRDFCLSLQRALRKQVEGLAVPKRFRFIRSTPQTEDGKQSLASLEALFNEPYDPGCINPQIISKKISGGEAEFELKVPKTLNFFYGHFPRSPVVAGVVQIRWVHHLAKEYLNLKTNIGDMTQLKFKNLLFPENRFKAKLLWDSKKNRLKFSFCDEKKTFSSGQLNYRPLDAD